VGNYDSAFDFLIALEDNHRHPGSTLHDSDGATRYGLLDRWHPDLVAQGFYTCPNDQALEMAKAHYQTEYWNRVQGEGISSNKVATQLFSIGVNVGITRAVKIAQSAVHVKADGVLGQGTLYAINATDEASFISAFDIAAKALYAAIAVAHPEKAGDVAGWNNRVDLISTYQG
jgi:lysozyme family protein